MAHFVGYTSPVRKNKKIRKKIICEIIKLQKTPCLNYIQKMIPYIPDKITWTVQILQIQSRYMHIQWFSCTYSILNGPSQV